VSTNANPYSSPAMVDSSALDPAREMPREEWGKLTLLWHVSFLFGYVWFLGAATMYLGLLWIPHLAPPSLHSQISYDALGYFSFISWSVIALIIGIYLILRNRRTLLGPWPDWHRAAGSFLRAALIMAPIWAIYIWLADRYYHRLPGEGEWVPISIGALLGIIHGYVCKRGLERQRTTSRQRQKDAN